MCGSRQSRRRGSEMQKAGKARRLVTQLDEEAVYRSIGYAASIVYTGGLYVVRAAGCGKTLHLVVLLHFFQGLVLKSGHEQVFPLLLSACPPRFTSSPHPFPLQRRILLNFSHLPSGKSLRIPLLSDCISLLYPSLLSLFVSLSSYL